MEKKKIAGIAEVMILTCANIVWPQSIYPSTVGFPVTYYDFHSDGSNPDFNPATNPATVLPGMVQPTLDATRLPVGTTTYLYSWGIGKWFRPWKQSLLGQGSDFVRPVYTDSGRTIAGVNTVGYDTTYKNFVFLDTLMFNYVPGSPGVFEYADTSFFPLDNRGIGNEGKNHNYSFAAAMHREIQYKTGLVYNFQSYDDMWVFVNGRLVLDLGGIHGTVAGQFNFDDFAAALGLSPGDSAALDIFWTQRSGVFSSIRISTSIVTACPVSLVLGFPPPRDTTISWGDSLALSLSIIYESCGTPHHLDSLIQWKLAIPAAGSLRTAQGPTNTYYPSDGLSNIIIMSYQDPSTGRTLSPESTTVFIRPPPMTYHLYIEPDTNINTNDQSAASYARLTHPDIVSLVSISQDDTVTHSVAAILRDKYGNFVLFSSNAVWQVVGDTGIVAISTPNKPYVCEIVGLKPGITYIRLSDDSGSVPDTVMVDNRHLATSVRPVMRPNRLTLKAIHEYYNLRGQKLPLYGLRHADGIVLERVIEPTGKARVQKRIQNSGVNIQE
jgi:fibro-slime domain-containing protein